MSAKSFLAVTLTVLIGTFVGAFSGQSFAAGCPASPVTAKSGAQTASIVELYTSEGCDSCPPADKWFSALRPQANATAALIPLAFHVDYWDYIGWKDKFANARFADRQRATVARHGSRTVYTPQVMLDGRDNRTWMSTSRFDASLREVAVRPARASLLLAASVNTGTIDFQLDAAVLNEADRGDAKLYVAITENNLESRVTSGENRGVTLRHDNVVRELLGPFPVPAQGAPGLARSLRIAREWKREDLAIAAFVQNQRDGSTLQAVRLSLCEK